jgi:putative toxin-antitoxin system antitoxin component (TIGR02293 family)
VGDWVKRLVTLRCDRIVCVGMNFYRAFQDRLSEFLDVPVDASASDIHEIIDADFPIDRFKTFRERGQIPPQQRDQIIPLKRLSARLTLGQKFTENESDRRFRNAYILAMAALLFGNEEKARSWLSKRRIVVHTQKRL